MRTGVYLNDEDEILWRASGMTIAELVKIGLRATKHADWLAALDVLEAKGGVISINFPAR